MRKTEEQFEADVQTMTERIGLASQLQRKREVEKLVARHESELAKAKQELEDAYSKLSPIVTACFNRWQASENELTSLSNVEAKLTATCLDPAILEREKELQVHRKELMQKLRPLVADLEHAQAILRGYESSVESIRYSLTKDIKHAPSVHEKRSSLRASQERLEHQTSVVDQLSHAVSRLNEELHPIDVELAKLQLQKLVP